MSLLFHIIFIFINHFNLQPINCNEPNVLILLDVSGTMGKASDPNSKYNKAVKAIEYIVKNEGDKIRFGLMVFPKPGTGYCSIDTKLVIDFALNNYSAFYNYLDPNGSKFFGGPQSYYDTPMYQALNTAKGIKDLYDPQRRSYILLITDGYQDCCNSGDYDDEPDCLPGTKTLDPVEFAENREDIVNVVKELWLYGIMTFAVGFGSGVDALTLNQIAQAGHTKISDTCNPNGTTIGPDNCFYKAENETTLKNALDSITKIIENEQCDGFDNDCDGLIDEDFIDLGKPCDGEDSDKCKKGVFVCSPDGKEVICDEDLSQNEVELCNGIDDDCDGEIDEDFPLLGQPCDGDDPDNEKNGKYICSEDKKNVICDEQPGKVELCNGIDDDGDGLIDELWPQLGEICDSSDEDKCKNGIYVCSQDGTDVVCNEDPSLNKIELCNGLDDDCDGEIDEDFPLLGQPCDGDDDDFCKNGIYVCEKNTSNVICKEELHLVEKCNNKDDDCDQIIDNGDNLCPPNYTCINGECVKTIEEDVVEITETFEEFAVTIPVVEENQIVTGTGIKCSINRLSHTSNHEVIFLIFVIMFLFSVNYIYLKRKV